MDSREGLRALRGSLGGILRGHLAASHYIRVFSDTDGKRPLKGNIGGFHADECSRSRQAQFGRT